MTDVAPSWLRRSVRWAVGLVLLVVAGAAVYVVVTAVQVVLASLGSFRAPAGEASAIVVIGAPTEGSRPGADLRARCEEALTLFVEHRAREVVVLGGPSRPGGPTEAAVAGRFLLASGLPRADLSELPLSSVPAAFSLLARRFPGRDHRRVLLVGDRLEVLWLGGLAASDRIDAGEVPVTPPGVGLLAGFGHVWVEAAAVALGRVVGFGRTAWAT